ncbi:MAG: hypothetical protein HWD58_21340 [Bacteroidota bacterium]|nr:MAG: hypothetical protein HWD58_21340 [Bacteroidota bacterium]
MTASLSKIITGLILAFHLFITGHNAWLMYSETGPWNLMKINPILQMLFTLIWTGIVFRQRIFGFIYFIAVLFELAMKLFFGKTEFGQVFGAVFIPPT